MASDIKGKCPMRSLRMDVVRLFLTHNTSSTVSHYCHDFWQCLDDAEIDDGN